ncbi:hypothetical protein CBS147353_10595 [Aspergillus niger]|nr:hypothetical protein CBS147353_10595 [Aspergillus niger]
MENSLHSPDTFEGAALDKYTLINRYISIALVKRRGLTSSAGALSAKAADKKPWCAFWKKSGDGVEAGFVRPDERFETDMRSYLRAFDIEPRRKRTGFNGLTAAKTNFFVQSTGYSRAGSSMCHRRYPVPQHYRRLVTGEAGPDVAAPMRGDIAMNATAFRAWQAQEILACELVTGDIVVTEEDTTAPADVRLICDYDKPEKFETYRDKAYAVVTVTARQTFVGKTAAFVQGANDSAHSKAIVDYMGGTFLILVMFWIKVIIQKLTAIESLAGVDVLCFNKTGTLIADQLSIRGPYVNEGDDGNWVMSVAAIASNHNVKNLGPIDKATIPHPPPAILNMSQCSEEEVQKFRDKATESARCSSAPSGLPSRRRVSRGSFFGMYPMFDPPREVTAHAVAEAQHLGLQVKMVTGDASAIAKETCKMLALQGLRFERLIHGVLAGSAQNDLVEKAVDTAVVSPEHKLQVVEMLQQRGHLRAMTSDGVNDAPYLKKVDCGITVEGSTKSAQAAADIVFLAPRLSTIVDAIKLARQIFQHLIVFTALFAVLTPVAVAYDNAHFEARPVEWQLPKVSVISVIPEIIFLEVSLTGNWLIFLTRWAKPGLRGSWLAPSSAGSLGEYEPTNSPSGAKFSVNSDVDIFTVVVIWAYSIGVVIVIAVVYYLLTLVAALDIEHPSEEHAHPSPSSPLSTRLAVSFGTATLWGL